VEGPACLSFRQDGRVDLATDILISSKFCGPSSARLHSQSGLPALRTAAGSSHSLHPLACRDFKSSQNAIQEKRPHFTTESFFLEGPVRLELTTPCLKGRCSNRLSYGPASNVDLLSRFGYPLKSFDFSVAFSSQIYKQQAWFVNLG
jgi:hypothetical protein